MRKLLRGIMRPIGPMGPIRLIGLMGLIGPMALMGCSSSDDSDDEELPVTGTPIAFSAKEGEETAVNNGGSNKAPRANETNGANRAFGVTRSTPLSDKGIISFHVWGYKNMDYSGGSYGDLQTVFPGYTVHWEENSALTTTTNTDSWEYILTAYPDQTIKYWDWAAKAYRFFGVTGSPSEADGTYGADGTYWTYGTYKTYKITIDADASSTAAMTATPYFSRLWFSTGSEALYPTRLFGKPVTLEFLKPYSRVRFIFKYVYPREGIKLTEISFKPTTVGDKIARKGTVTVHYPKEGSETKEWYTMGPETGTGSEELDEFTVDYDPEDDGKTYSAPMTSDGWYMVLPNNTQGSYTLSVKVNGETKTAVVPQQYMQWLPGYSYTYIFKITDEGGVEIGWVEYAVTPWSEMEADHPVYNW